VKLLIAISRLLCLVAVLGLVVAPLARPAAAQPGAMPSTSMDVAATDSEMAMPEGMPCCPEKAPVPDCAKSCPLMALCLSVTVSTLPSGTILPMQIRQSQSIPFLQGVELLGLGCGPPTRPPKV
jgi:hypothetical protein